MDITLDEKIYVAPRIKARMFRRAIELSDKMENQGVTVKISDEMVEFIVDVFGKQFTVNDLYDNLESNQLLPTVMKCMSEVIGDTTDKIQSKNELAAVIK